MGREREKEKQTGTNDRNRRGFGCDRLGEVSQGVVAEETPAGIRSPSPFRLGFGESEPKCHISDIWPPLPSIHPASQQTGRSAEEVKLLEE